MSSEKIPSPHEAGLAFEMLANTCELVTISHGDDGQRVTVVYNGRSLTNVDAFASRAAVRLRSRLCLPQLSPEEAERERIAKVFDELAADAGPGQWGEQEDCERTAAWLRAGAKGKP